MAETAFEAALQIAVFLMVWSAFIHLAGTKIGALLLCIPATGVLAHFAAKWRRKY